MTTTSTHLPSLEDTAKFIGELLGAKVTAAECPGLAADSVATFADYSDDDNTTQHFIACDISSAAILGAALTGVPPSVVEETVSDGTLPDNLEENFQEVLNISTNLFPQSNQCRIALDKISQSAAAIERFESSIETPQIHMTIDVPRYGVGVIVIGAS